MSSKLYVGNLPFSSSQDELHDLFSRHGEVVSVNVITDRETGRPRGFAFVEMEDSESADNAVRALDGVQLGGRTIKVNPAQDRRNERGGNDRGGSDRGGFDRAPRRY